MKKDMAAYMKNRRAKRRLAVIEYLGGECVECGEDDPEFLQINHVDRTEKLFTLSGCALDKAWYDILDEADKCELLCPDCHIRYTAEQYATKQIRPWNDKTDEPLIHGSARCYQEKPCRCALCKIGKRLYRSQILTYATPVRAL